MYSTCISCYRKLGTNDVLARLPIGRVVAFDRRRGRLWVVCLACRCWNLVPVEERWEAVEEATAQFQAARRRASTGEISLAFLKGGFSLIGIGEAGLPEFAAWRYGTELFGRWLRSWRGAHTEFGALGIGGGTALISAAAVAAAGLAAPVAAGAALLGVPAGLLGWSHLAQRRRESTLCWTFGDAGAPQRVSIAGAATAALKPGRDDDGGWIVSLVDFEGPRQYEGYTAGRVLGAVLAYQNRFGAGRRAIDAAVGQIEEAGHSAGFIDRIAQKGAGSVSTLPRTLQLGLEISLHEVSERKTLEGQLLDLTREWYEAEAIAEIADGLFVPETISQQLRRLRART